MKKFNFSKKFERLTSFVLALMLVLSVFTASNVAVFADTEDKNVKTKETQDQVDLYVKSSTVPCIKSSTEKNYQVMSAYANGYYSAKVNKAGTAVSSPDSADKAKYQLADFTMDDSKVYFVKPADWNSSDIKAHFWNSNGKANDIRMDSVSNSVFLKDSKSNTVSNLTLGINEKLYSVTIPAGMTNVIFYYNNYEYNNYEKQTNDIINISAGNCYKLTEGTTENGTIFNAESIGSVGSLNKLNKSYSFTESTVIDFTDFSAVKTLKMSDLKLKAGDTELSENSETVLEKSNDKFSVENANGFDVKVYYNNTEITSVSDIKEYDKKVSLTVKLSDIPDMTREYEVKVNSGLVIDGGKWQFNKTDVTSIENNINVYAPSSGKEFEVTPKFEPKLKCNGESVNSGTKITYYNSNDEEIQKLEFTNSDSKTLKYKVSYNNYTVTGEITVNCYFVSVALTSLASDTNSFVDESKETIYQKDENCSYDVKLDSNLTAKDINFSIDNGAKVDYSSSSNSNKLTISNLTKESNLTIKYPTEEGFEVKKYKVVPDNKAPEIEEIKFDSENAKFDVDNGLYKNGDITFTIKLKNEDSGSGIFDGSLTGNDVFSCNFDQSKNVFNCTLRDKTINGDTVFTITDRVGNKESFSFNKLIDSGKVYVYNTPITNNNFEVVSSTEKPTANISSYNATGTNAFNDNNIYHGDQLTVTLDLNNVISGLQSISGLSVSGFESYNFSNFKLTKINEKEQSVTANSFDELATEFENQATNEKVKSATVTFDIDIKDNPNYSGSHKLSLTVTDNSGNVNSGVDNSTFYVDNTAPEITNVEFVKTTNPTVTDQILNFLTFGIYSNDTIVMNVTATDYAPTSGLPSDTITVKNGESVISGSSATADSNATENSTVIYSYELGNKDSAYDLSFTVKDNAGNTATKSLVDLIKEDKEKTKKVVVANADFTADFTKDDYDNITDFEVVSNNEEDFTFIDTFTGTDEKEYDDNDNIIRHGKSINVTSQVKVSNKAGVNNISNIECYYYNDDQNTENKVTVSADEKYDYSSKKTTSAKINFNITTKETGKYILKYTATNNAGVSKTNTKTFYVDNTAPEITKVEFSKKNNTLGKILNFLTFGIYSNDTIVMNVTATDNAPTSGLPSDSAITVKNDNKENLDVKEIKDAKLASNATESSTVTYTYELGNSDSAYNLSFTVKDNANNVNENIALADLVKDNKVKANDKSLTEEQLKNVSDVFEVVSSTKNDLSVVTNINGINYGDDSNIIVSGAETKVESTVNLGEDLTGAGSIGNFRCAYYQDSAAEITSTPTSYVTITHNNKDFTSTDVHQSYVSMDRVTKDQESKFDYVVSTEKSGKYVLTYTVINNAGVEKTVDKTFYVDNTAPQVTNVEFVKTSNPTVTDQILNFLTFGIYSNDTIVMNVTATDYAPTSGLPSDTITVKNGESVKESETEESNKTADSNATDSSTVTYSYELGNSDSAYNLSFTVKDNAGNTATKSLVDLIKEDKEKTEKVVVANANITKVDYDKIEGFEVVSNNEENFTFTDTFTGADKKVYDVNDNIIRHGESINVKSQVEVSDKAGINNISNIECYYKDDQKPENKVNVSAAEKYDYSSKKTISAEINFNITTKETGKYILKYTATNNAGVSKTNTKTFYVDNTAPVISQFTFKNGNPAKNPDSVIKTEYGYYFKNTTTVEVTAVDGGVDSPVSGVSEIHFYTIGTDGIQSDEQIVSVSGNNQTSYKATFTVPANFKGNVYAYAVDKAGNCYYFDTTTNKDDSQPVTPDRVVVENSSKHEQMSGIDISLPATNYIESSNKLYNNDVNVALNVSDSYSGIAKIEYSVSSEFDTDNNWDGSIEYSNDQSATTAMNGNGTVSGWKIEESDQNLVTKASSTITVKNNSNNIKIEVKLTDRAGNVSTKKETLSIDKTKPTIKIEYDNNNHTTHNGTEFYKANRTATITVTERNFSPEDVISKITNTDNVIPQITGWTTHNVANGENPDGTTHTATVVYASDGDYIFDIAFTDMAGNKADKVAQHKFTVDKTIPTINVSFDNNSAKNNNYYKADRTATITVNEHNFNAQDVKVNISATVADKSTAATAPSVSSWTSNGNIHTATVKFANDGKYAFDVNYTDLADNAAKENVVTTFYVDKTAPAVKISNVENESANSGNVAPVINLGDNNYSGDYVLTLTRVDIEAKKTDVTNDFVSTVVPTSNTGAVVTYANFASDEVNDGIYVLNAALTDKAGNSSNDTITFSVNRFGSTYMGGNKETNDLLDNGYTNAEKDIVISEINVDKLTKSNISLSLDSSSLKTLKQNVDYTVNEDAKTGQWHKYNYTVKSSNFVNEGNYSIELSSTDAAKNTSTNRIRPIENRKLAVQFVVDKTAPVVNIAGIENNALYEENSKDVTVVCEDSYIDANSLVIKLDDKTLKEGKDYTVEKDVASISAKIKVNATSDITAQNVKVSVKDMAQNSGDGSVENFTLSATLLMRFFANPVLVIISAVLFAGIIALVIFIVAKKRRKN